MVKHGKGQVYMTYRLKSLVYYMADKETYDIREVFALLTTKLYELRKEPVLCLVK